MLELFGASEAPLVLAFQVWQNRFCSQIFQQMGLVLCCAFGVHRTGTQCDVPKRKWTSTRCFEWKTNNSLAIGPGAIENGMGQTCNGWQKIKICILAWQKIESFKQTESHDSKNNNWNFASMIWRHTSAWCVRTTSVAKGSKWSNHWMLTKEWLVICSFLPHLLPHQRIFAAHRLASSPMPSNNCSEYRHSWSQVTWPSKRCRQKIGSVEQMGSDEELPRHRSCPNSTAMGLCLSNYLPEEVWVGFMSKDLNSSVQPEYRRELPGSCACGICNTLPLTVTITVESCWTTSSCGQLPARGWGPACRSPNSLQNPPDTPGTRCNR